MVGGADAGPGAEGAGAEAGPEEDPFHSYLLISFPGATEVYATDKEELRKLTDMDK